MSVRRMLIDGFTDGAYADDPAPSTAGMRYRPYHPAPAWRWLSTLAFQARQVGGHDLQWWQMHPARDASHPARTERGVTITGALLAAGLTYTAVTASGQLLGTVLSGAAALGIPAGAWAAAATLVGKRRQLARWVATRCGSGSTGCASPPTGVG
jgi:hypothetical protein